MTAQSIITNVNKSEYVTILPAPFNVSGNWYSTSSAPWVSILLSMYGFAHFWAGCTARFCVMAIRLLPILGKLIYRRTLRYGGYFVYFSKWVSSSTLFAASFFPVSFSFLQFSNTVRSSSVSGTRWVRPYSESFSFNSSLDIIFPASKRFTGISKASAIFWSVSILGFWLPDSYFLIFESAIPHNSPSFLCVSPFSVRYYRIISPV